MFVHSLIKLLGFLLRKLAKLFLTFHSTFTKYLYRIFIKNLVSASEQNFAFHVIVVASEKHKKKTQKHHRKRRSFSSKHTHNGIGILSRRNGERKFHAKAATNIRSQRGNMKSDSGFARLSFGKVQRRSLVRCWISAKGAVEIVSSREDSWQNDRISVCGETLPLFIHLRHCFKYDTQARGIQKSEREKQALYRGKNLLCL